MASVTTCPEDRTFRAVLMGDASFELELEIARHLTVCGKCAARMNSALASELTRGIVQKRGEDRPLWQFYADASKLSLSAATVREDEAVEPTLHLHKDPVTGVLHETPVDPASPPPSAASVSVSIYSFLSPPESKDELGRLGVYCITKLLGAGGMGMVFQAEDTQLRRSVALKVMRPEIAAITNAHDRFLREARTMASMEHDHVVAVFQVGEERGVPFLAMPLLQGMSLDTVLKKNISVPLMASLRIGYQIASGLAAAHARGLIHRDIKPANIWIETKNNNRVKLLDFGLARDSEEEANLTHTGAVLGTPAYMAPEQAAGGAIDARADLFSLGVILYQLTTGKRPFGGTGTMAILTALAIHDPTPPCEVNDAIPENVSAFILRLLQKTPDQRPCSAEEVVSELAALMKAKVADSKETFTSEEMPSQVDIPVIQTMPRRQEVVSAPSWITLLILGLGLAGLIGITAAVFFST